MIPGAPLQHAVAPGLLLALQALLSMPVVLWGGWPFFLRGRDSLRERSANMFTLIALGVGVAWGYSVGAIVAFVVAPELFPSVYLGHGGLPHVYFEAAATIVTLVLLGKVLELRARSGTSAALRPALAIILLGAHAFGCSGRAVDQRRSARARLTISGADAPSAARTSTTKPSSDG